MAGDLLPFFSVYPAETLADERFSGWTFEERGAWFTLILYCWVNGSIPAQPGEIARLLRVPNRSFSRLWTALSDRFIAHPDREGRLTSRRLELERESAIARGNAARNAASTRWHRKPGHASALPSHMRSQCADPGGGNAIRSDQIRSVEACAEAPPAAPPPAERSPTAGGGETPAPKPKASPPPPPDSPVVALLPCVGKGAKEYSLTAAEVSEFAAAYPGLDVMAEVRKARAWLVANRTRRKTHDGIPRFLLNWLNKAQNSNPNRKVGNDHDSLLFAALATAEREYVEGEHDNGWRSDDGGVGRAPPIDAAADSVASLRTALPASLRATVVRGG